MRLKAALIAVALSGCGQKNPPASPNASARPGPRPAQTPRAPADAGDPAARVKPQPSAASDEPAWARWDPAQSTSVGNVLEGHLKGAVQLPTQAPGMRHNPNKSRERAYGTVEVVRAIIRAGQALADRPPAEHILINDLSFEQGGSIEGHASHRAGRDFDFYFPLQDARGAPFPGKLIPLDPRGEGYDYRELTDPADDLLVRIDLARTWAFISTLLDDPDGKVQVIYLVAHLQSALADYAKRHGAPTQQIERFLSHSCQPSKVPHDDHGHVRFYCSAQDIAAGCEDNAPIHPEHRATLAKAGVTPKIARPAPRAARNVKTTSAAKARKRAGAMHPSVSAFLDARKGWSRNIPPGPARCR